MIRCPHCSRKLPEATVQAVVSELARRRGAKRKTHGAGPGRPVKLVACAQCGASGPTRQMRGHRCENLRDKIRT